MAMVVVMTRTCSEPRHIRTPERTRRNVRARISRQALFTRTTVPPPASRRSHARLVADATHRHDDLGLLGVVLDLRAEPLHVDVHEPCVCRVPVAPDLLEQDLAREHLP